MAALFKLNHDPPFRWEQSANREHLSARSNVRFGSKADMCAGKRHVRFTPNSDRESRLPQKVMSASPPKADMCVATRDVRFGPKADIATAITSCGLSSFSSAVASLASNGPSDLSLIPLRPRPVRQKWL